MFNYIKADFYRIFSKKGMYVYFLILLSCMVGGLYVGLGSISLATMPLVADMCFTLFGLLASAYLLNTVYNDDFSAKTVPSVVGVGNNRVMIVLAKLLVSIVLTLLVFAIAVVTFYLFLTFFGFQFDTPGINVIISMALGTALKGIAITCVVSILIYLLQKGTAAIVAFIMINVGFFTAILLLVLDKFKLDSLGKYRIDEIIVRLMKEATLETVLPYVIYVTAFTVLAIFVFKQRDLDF